MYVWSGCIWDEGKCGALNLFFPQLCKKWKEFRLKSLRWRKKFKIKNKFKSWAQIVSSEPQRFNKFSNMAPRTAHVEDGIPFSIKKLPFEDLFTRNSLFPLSHSLRELSKSRSIKKFNPLFTMHTQFPQRTNDDEFHGEICERDN